VVWFPQLELNYAETCLRGRPDQVSLVAVNESGRQDTWTRRDLTEWVARVAGGLRVLGVDAGDRVAGYLPNTPEALVVMLAAASIGAVWTCCPPEFGPDAVIDRFRRVALVPKGPVEGLTDSRLIIHHGSQNPRQIAPHIWKMRKPGTG